MNRDRGNRGPSRGIWTGIVIAIATGAAGTGCGGGDQVGGGPGSGEDWSKLTTADRTWDVWWRPIPAAIPALEPFSVEVMVRDAAGRPAGEGVSVVVDATMPHHGHGMNVTPVVSRDGDLWLAEGLLLHMPGRWEFTVDVVREGEIERAQWTEELES